MLGFLIIESEKIGPLPLINLTGTPIASGIVKMSVKVIAASSGYLLNGCKVSSLQISGCLIMSKKSEY